MRRCASRGTAPLSSPPPLHALENGIRGRATPPVHCVALMVSSSGSGERKQHECLARLVLLCCGSMGTFRGGSSKRSPSGWKNPGTAEEAAEAFDAAVVKLRGLAQSNLNIPVAVAVQPSASVTLVKAEIEEEHGDGVDAVERRGKKALPDAQTKFALVHTLVVAGRNYGKKPRFFQQLEPLHGPAGTAKQVTERQEAIQHRFLEVVDKREQDRMIREEAWRRQEMARLAHERAMAATHNAAVLSNIQKFTGQCIPMPPIAAVPIRFMPPPSSRTHATPIFYAAASPPSSQPPLPRPLNPPTRPPTGPQPQKSPASATVESPQQQAPVVHQSSTDIMTAAATPHDGSGGGGGAAASSLWSEAEVHALIQLRTNLDMRQNGRPHWEEVSAGMLRMGYNRSSQWCMEKCDPQMVRMKWGAVDSTAVVVNCVSRDSVQHSPT
ncbi:hypothetical protein ACQ4PT_051342 [Festuca glaucescens]